MARTKQATPLRREPSSEYSSKYDRAPRTREASATQPMVELANGEANGKAPPKDLSSAPRAETKTPVTGVAKKEAGILTLIIDVAGIYASL